MKVGRRWGIVVAGALTLFLATVVPAQAVGSFRAPVTLVNNCNWGTADATGSAAGDVAGFVSCGNAITFFRYSGGSASSATTGYVGDVLASAWDGADTTFVVFAHANTLRLGKRTLSTGAMPSSIVLATGAGSKGFTADIAASAGKYWAVWSKPTNSTAGAQTELWQQRTLNGTTGPTRITVTASNIDDDQPSVAYADGKLTLAWHRRTVQGSGGPEVIRLGTSTGGLPTAANITANREGQQRPSVAVDSGHTYVAWTDSGQNIGLMERDNASGSWKTQEAANGYVHILDIAVSRGTVFLAYNEGDNPQVDVAERHGSWTTTSLTNGVPHTPVAVAAANGKATVLYRTSSELILQRQN